MFSAHGELLGDIPCNVKVLEVNDCFHLLGISQNECNKLADYIARAFFAAIAKLLSFRIAVHLMLLFSCFQKAFKDQYDISIAYLHSSGPKSFYGGVVEYVLYRTNSIHKSCFIHCDYLNSGTATEYSNSLYRKFDSIVGVSYSVSNQFLKVLPDMRNKTHTVYNAIDKDMILGNIIIGRK